MKLRLSSLHHIDHPNRRRYGGTVVFNSATEIGVSNNKADGRLMRHFLCPSNTIGASFSMAGRGGRVERLAGPLLPVRQSRHAPATLDWRRGVGITLNKEATMPSIALRVIRTLFPIYAAPISTLPTLIEARTLAALLVAQGRRVVIQHTEAGYTVGGVQ